MHLVVLGLSHTTAPVEVRERLFISEEAPRRSAQRAEERGAKEAMVLSTCNRTEVYATSADIDAPKAPSLGP